MNQFSNKIIVALDTDNLAKAKNIVKTLLPRVKFFKIGLEFINTGKAPKLIKFIKKLGGKIFYDIKLNDIPNTVAGASKVISKLGVDMFTIHASSGKESLRAAVENRGKAKVIGVAILTSFNRVSKNKIFKLSKLLTEEGVDGIVCSVQEAGMIRNKFTKIEIITPGIRPKWADKNEQKRIATPKEAILAGADYLVIGRPITQPPKQIGSLRRALDLVIGELEK